MAARMMLCAVAVLLAPPLAAASLPDPTALPASLSSAPAGAAPEEAGLAWVRVNGPRSIAWYGGTTVKAGRFGERRAGDRHPRRSHCHLGQGRTPHRLSARSLDPLAVANATSGSMKYRN